ncbi:transglutaminase family protein [Occultella aeris]|uniref:Protein-glutamine gamma-glutamyltransferase n=1 Tax=Occultella aeris TaxID=2761496 RepID=A0A7M4DEG6_9MICO|nr:transglutaminase family protein [Occultella aeris]VZO35281.1 Protein-glutamine gamma-glutamyltransferase [Occultella aeris]
MSRTHQGDLHYRLTHTTTYTYPEEVTSSYGRALLLPRRGAGQQVHASGLAVEPGADLIAEHKDWGGNRSTYFHVTQPHQQLRVTGHSVISTGRRRADPGRLPPVPWEQVAQLVRTLRPVAPGDPMGGPGAAVSIADSRLASPMVELSEEVREYALPSFEPSRPVAEVVAELATRIHADFAYRPGATSVSTTLPEVLAGRAGVCQDFAHLLIGCVRSMGLAARYVSGYLETMPPPGREKLRGVDASHAWASVWLPGGGWLNIDPTNDQFIDGRYVVLGWGRDYRDVSPLRGIVFTDGSGSKLEVGVDLWPVEKADLAEHVAEVESLVTPATQLAPALR